MGVPLVHSGLTELRKTEQERFSYTSAGSGLFGKIVAALAAVRTAVDGGIPLYHARQTGCCRYFSAPCFSCQQALNTVF